MTPDAPSFLKLKVIELVRFVNEEVYRNMDGVLETILAKLDEQPSPRLRGEGRVRGAGD